MAVLNRFLKIIRDKGGDAVVEATILFPIMILIFAALVLLAVYLPSRAALQRATQYAATALATECSDTWLFFDEGSMSYRWETEKSGLKNVYVALFSGIGNAAARGEDIVTEIEKRGVSSKAGELSVDCYIVNRIVYKEVVVTAARTFKPPVDLALIRFPGTIIIEVTSTAVVQNGDEFVRNMDIAVDFVKFIGEKYELDDIAKAISGFRGKVASLLGW